MILAIALLTLYGLFVTLWAEIWRRGYREAQRAFDKLLNTAENMSSDINRKNLYINRQEMLIINAADLLQEIARMDLGPNYQQRIESIIQDSYNLPGENKK